MRAFIALEIPEEIKKEIGKIQQDLKRANIQARWIKPEISHLTLVFSGAITPDKIEPIGAILEQSAKDISPISLGLAKIGCFPSPTKARIIFVGLQGELEKLNALDSKIRNQLKREKIWFDKKPFTAHLTLGRIKKRQDLTSVIQKFKISQVEFQADKVSLIQSTPSSAGPIYKELKSILLGIKINNLCFYP